MGEKLDTRSTRSDRPWRAGLFVVAVIVLFHSPALFTARAYYQGDIASQLAPYRLFAQKSLLQGEAPFWCPNIFCGYPLLAEGQMGFFYPLNLVFYIGTPPYVAFKYAVFLHFLIAAAGMFVCARRFGRSVSAAVLASIVFALSGFFVLRLGQIALLNAAVWLPFLVYAMDRAIAERRIRWSVGAGALLALMVTAGNSQMALISMVGVLCLVAGRIVTGKACVRTVAGVLPCVCIIAIGLAAIQIFPTASLLPHTSRGAERGYELVTSWDLTNRHLVNLLLPNFHGNPVNGTWNGDWDYLEMVGFLGVLPLVLTLTAALGRRRRQDVFWLLLAAIGVFMALAEVNPLYRWLCHVPPFGWFRAPNRYLLLFTFAVAHGSACGMDAIISSTTRRNCSRLLLLSAFGVGSLCALLEAQSQATESTADLIAALASCGSAVILTTCLVRGKLSPRFASLGFVLLAAAELFRFGWGYNQVTSYDFYTQPSPLARWLTHDKERFRSSTGLIVNRERAARWRLDDKAHFQKSAMICDYAIQENQQVIGGDTPMSPLRQGLLQNEIVARLYDPRGLSAASLLGMLNCKYVASNAPIKDPKLQYVDTVDGMRVYLNPQNVPRAHLVTQVLVAPDDQTESIVLSPSFDPRHQVVVEQTPSLPVAPASEAGKCSIVSYKARRVEIAVDAVSNAMLVLSDAYYPNWECTIDGQPQPIFRANYVLRAVAVPGGKHQVVFSYDDPFEYVLGRAIALSTLVLLLAIPLLSRLRTQR
ncbi:MAG: hypothetical protein AUJ92_16250 [Armatimonadetes bacterium CG2_30_59_28]|nr:YfhO family protein [Armatimonadota bacterium]OIO91587.1 MAG: hypothetical protein AUJ92_16250 [Armatimonadetes bacterium CG2_30_59_28]PIU60654.1 MAG: hypothetical protein COS85_23360 [Armatimonadetes bacterium CG07_land_8_20_14_0_80_59_28]PIY41038.1 MAG: hypothetical protein COZ05_16400 [Armatimonadetes bacterium CG_4_10_14_3_um_filter_59_10]PJB62764.1 MAG: hypothetical protein CO095_17935 [Armatimonadetes bacterium CG_4_9_14_3_um_filter_58_7]